MTDDFRDIETQLGHLRPLPAVPLPPDLAARASIRKFQQAPLVAAVFLISAAATWWLMEPSPPVVARVVSSQEPGIPAGRPLRTGESLEISARGSLEISFGDGSRVHVGGSLPSEITLGPGPSRGEAFFLRRGAVTCIVQNRPGAFWIETPLGRVVDQGTVFTASLNEEKDKKEDKMTRTQKTGAGAILAVSVLSGWVSLENGEKTVPVRAGQTLTARADASPLVTSSKILENHESSHSFPATPSRAEKRLSEIDKAIGKYEVPSESQLLSQAEKLRIEENTRTCLRRVHDIGSAHLLLAEPSRPSSPVLSPLSHGRT